MIFLIFMIFMRGGCAVVDSNFGFAQLPFNDSMIDFVEGCAVP